jgi:Predicted transcriptional regulator
MVTKSIYLGPMENKLLFTLEEQDRLVFTIADAKKVLASSDPSVKNVIYRLKQKNRVKEIETGKYLLSPAKAGIDGYWSEHTFKLIHSLIDEYYVSYWSALNHWGMTEQMPVTVYVVIKKRKRDIRFDGQLIKFVTVSPGKFFGSTQEKLGDCRFNVASREKTIIDCLDRLEYSGGIVEVAKCLWNARDELDFDTLSGYTMRFQVESVWRRLGFLMELLGMCDDKTGKWLYKDFKGYRWLDYSARKETIRYDKKWGLKINVSEKELLEFKGV